MEVLGPAASLTVNRTTAVSIRVDNHMERQLPRDPRRSASIRASRTPHPKRFSNTSWKTGNFSHVMLE